MHAAKQARPTDLKSDISKISIETNTTIKLALSDN